MNTTIPHMITRFTAALIILISTVCITGCSNALTSPEIQTDNTPKSGQIQLNTEYLTEQNGRKCYQDPDWEVLTGIDVSEYQESIDWEAVKQDGIDFAIIRAGYRGYGYGKIVEDVQFQQNISAATQADIDVGIYFFSQAISLSEAKKEARYVADLIKDHPIQYPVVFDMEIITEDDRILRLSPKEKTQIAVAFCEEIKKLGYTPMIYGSTSWLQNAVFLEEFLKYNLWISDYSNAPDFPYPIKMWQYTSSGTVSGIEGKTDLNLYFAKKNSSK